MAYTGFTSRGQLSDILSPIKDTRLRALVKAAYEAGHHDGYMQALEEVY